MALAVHGLTKAYAGKAVLSGLDYIFSEGAVTCVMGASGSGKTTLLRLLMGLEAPDGGVIEGFAGRRMSAVFQEDRLCENLSATANVRLVCAPGANEKIGEALAAVGLDESGRPVRTFSGGMRRRVALVRALLADYDVLFLDEPFKGLDAGTREMAFAFLRAGIKGKSVIYVTHDPAEADFFNAQILKL